MKTKINAFIQHRANDILINNKFFELCDFNKRYRSLLLLSSSLSSRSKLISLSTTLTRRRFVATTIITTQRFFKSISSKMLRTNYFLCRKMKTTKTWLKKIEKKTIHFEQHFKIQKSWNFETEFVNDDKFNQNIVSFIEKTKIYFALYTKNSNFNFSTNYNRKEFFFRHCF